MAKVILIDGAAGGPHLETLVQAGLDPEDARMLAKQLNDDPFRGRDDWFAVRSDDYVVSEIAGLSAGIEGHCSKKDVL